MNITINTDASFCPDTKVGGYAFWITSGLGRIRYSNRFKKTLPNPTEAEIRCIINAVYSLSRVINTYNHKIVVNTDCLTAINAMRKRFPTIIFRHVESHQAEIKDSRSFVNNWCDKAARNEMRKAREGIKASKMKKLEWK